MNGSGGNGLELTPREKEVIQLIAQELTSKEIAVQLGISAKTVEYHKHSVRQKLGIKSIAGLVRFAIRQGWIEP